MVGSAKETRHVKVSDTNQHREWTIDIKLLMPRGDENRGLHWFKQLLGAITNVGLSSMSHSPESNFIRNSLHIKLLIVFENYMT